MTQILFAEEAGASDLMPIPADRPGLLAALERNAAVTAKRLGGDMGQTPAAHRLEADAAAYRKLSGLMARLS